ncbi:MAG: hypothetical protein ABFS37_13025, partial [Acidobacteriota bacterium]
VAYSEGRSEEIPSPRRVRPTENLRWVAACFVGPDGRWLLRRVQEGPILRGLWLPPLADLEDDDDPTGLAVRLAPEGLAVKGAVEFGGVRHHITHRRIEVIPVLIDAQHADLSAATWQWTRPGAVVGGTSSLFEKLHKVIRNSGKDN